MVSVVTSGAVCGIESFLVQVEVDVSGGLPGLELVGLLSSEVREARERVRVALKNAGVFLPPMRITVSLSPADVRKQGSAFDLPIAAAILVNLGCLNKEEVQDAVVVGELSLDGRVKPVRGILPIVLEARRQGKTKCIVPVENEQEAGLIEGISICPVGHLKELFCCTEEEDGIGQEDVVRIRKREKSDLPQSCQKVQLPDFEELGGSVRVRRAAEIAAAGFHHMLMIGPPGSGKTMTAKCMPGILPPLDQEESLEVSAVYSVAGLWQGRSGLMESRPFVSPHHTITPQALTGGGSIPRPGAVSLAHRGILFLDELTEFKRSTLDLLRQPLEEKKICIARSYGNYTYPAEFMLVAAANPCPCGYYPDLRRCRCTENEIRRYLGRISGPVLDRIDLCVETNRLEFSELKRKQGGGQTRENSSSIRTRVMLARRRQEERFRDSGILFNAQMGMKELERFCALGESDQQFMQQAFERMALSARAYHRILRVSRTIADLEGAERIERRHLSEALSFRTGMREK